MAATDASNFTDVRADISSAMLARKQAYLKVLAGLTMGAASLVMVSHLYSGMSPWQALLGSGCALVAGALSLYLHRWRQPHAAALVLLVGALVWIGWITVLTGGARSVVVGAYITIGALAGWMLGRRWMLALMLSSLTLLLGMELFFSDWVQLQRVADNPQRVLVGLVVVFGLCGSLLYLVFRESDLQLEGLRQARQAQLTTNQHFELIANNVPGLMSHWGRDMRCRWLNARYLSVMRRSAADCIGRSMDELWSPSVCEEAKPYIAQVLAGQEVRYETVQRMDNGQARVWLVQLVPDRLPSGEVDGWFGLLRDVTSQHQAAQAMHESRQRLGLAVDLAGLVYWELERDSEVLRWGIDVDRREGATHWTWSRYLGVLHPEDRDRVASDMSAAWQGGQLSSHYRYLDADGATQWAMVKAQVRPGDAGGLRMIGVWQNITEAELAQRALAASEARLQSMLDNTPAVAVQQFDRDGRVLYWNRASEQLTGLSAELCVGQSLSALLWPQGVDPRWAEGWRRALSGDAVAPFELNFMRSDGDERSVLCSLFALLERSGEQRLVAMTVDLTERRRAADALRQVQQSFESVFLESPTPARIFAADGHNQTLACNDAFCELFGLGRDALMSRSMRELNLHFDPEARDAVFATLLREGRVQNEELVVRTERGEQRTVLTSMLPVTWHGQPAWMSQLVDITERKRAEEDLRANRRLLEWVIDALPMCIFAKDTQSRYVMVNQAMADFMCSTKEALTYRHTSDVAAVDKSRSLADDAWVFSHRKALIQPDVELRGPRGEPTPFHSVKVPLFDERGELQGLLGINRNIAEEKRARAVLEASEQRLAVMFQHSPAALAMIDAKGIYRSVNEAWLRLFAYPEAQVLGRSSPEFGLFVDAADRVALYQQMRGRQRVDQLELDLRRADGQVLRCVASGRTLLINGERMHLYGIVDVSDQRRAQRQMEQMNQLLEQSVAQRTQALTEANGELKQALESLHTAQEELLRSEKHAALGRMVAGVAHELNTPIGNSVLVATTLGAEVDAFARQAQQGLTRSALSSHVQQTRDAVDMLVKNLSRAADLISTFKQVAADQTSLQRRPFELGEMVQEILQMHRPLMRTHEVQVQAHVPQPVAMDSYPGPLGQVLVNLMTNAMLHAYEGVKGGVVDIQALSRRPGWVDIEVRDHGQGIEPEALRRIFDPFYTTKLGRGGTGLGLAICQTLVTRVLGGELQVESVLGEGTCFVMSLPVVAPVVSSGAGVELPGGAA
ncbi:PAS domain-containing protein [Curvibacter sp. RS43]|uniref:PAS domain-containing sensor histidine kinase n=1 Tax=Curvibacter microcysteis TaxID=3026419 RepID=UPI00235F66BF|nr:PAS domain-containing protein [Curvibacter sp. RS43]MDD0809406.1 PAS domain-containing protein [Curvibacter sp. RS43]